ncbi:MAG TPA: hypothetical protein PKX00_01070 [Opitutaceae bacterium]|nr:hypothetical protein [Opitutaceae bacterium]
MRATLFPLRSNAAWFTNAATVDSLRQRLKAALLLYDRVYFQEGRYHCTIWDRGAMDGFFPLDSLSREQRLKYSFQAPGKEASLAMTPTEGGPTKVLFSGVPKAYYSADFFPLIEEAGLRNHSAISLVNGDWDTPITDPAKTFLMRHQSDLRKVTPEAGHFYADAAAKAFLYDTTAAAHFGMSINFDHRSHTIAEWVRKQRLAQVRDEIAAVFFQGWIDLGLPDFTNEKWERIIAIRDSAAGISFRKLISELELQIASEAPHVTSAADLDEIVKRKLVGKMAEELLQRKVSTTQAVISLGLNFTPVSLIANAKEFYDALKDGRSWINLLQPPKPDK